MRRSASKQNGRLRGIGMAMFIEPCGGGASPQEQAAIRFGESGNATLHVLSGPSGQGHETMFARIVAQVLSVPEENIEVRPSDPSGPPLMGGGTVGSRSLMSHGGALYATAHDVVRKGLEFAGRELEAAAADIEFKDGRYRIKGTDRSIAFTDVAKRYGNALDTLGGIPTPVAFPGGAHVCEVEIDPETGVVEVASYVAVDDCGRVLDHTLVEGQFHGGIVQGLGQALAEHCVYDATGQLLSGSFMDYAMPRADLLTQVALYDHSVPSPTNPLGVKGAGEAGTTGAIPAVANAVMDALRPLGIRHLDFPYSPAKVWQAIARARERA